MDTGKFTKRVRQMSSQLFVTLYTYTVYLSLCTQKHKVGWPAVSTSC